MERHTRVTDRLFGIDDRFRHIFDSAIINLLAVPRDRDRQRNRRPERKELPISTITQLAHQIARQVLEHGEPNSQRQLGTVHELTLKNDDIGLEITISVTDTNKKGPHLTRILKNGNQNDELQIWGKQEQDGQGCLISGTWSLPRQRLDELRAYSGINPFDFKVDEKYVFFDDPDYSLFLRSDESRAYKHFLVLLEAIVAALQSSSEGVETGQIQLNVGQHAAEMLSSR